MTVRIVLLLIALVFSKYTLACAWTGELTPGQAVTGQLSAADCISSDGLQYYDVYYYSGLAGERLTLSLTSSGFSPSIDVAYSDPFEWVASNSRSVGNTVRLPANGNFTLPKDGYYAVYIWPQFNTTPLTGSYSLTMSVDNSITNVVEYYHAGLDHYFLTANSSEAAAIDSGSAGAWERTGNIFKAGGSTSVCRFYGSMSPGPNSHFYTVNDTECSDLYDLQLRTPDTEKRWNYEESHFFSTSPTNGVCPHRTQPVYRAYNNGYARGVDGNHRITSNPGAIQEVVARGWHNEGVVMCAPN